LNKSPSVDDQVAALEQAIAAQESLRPSLGDAVVDAAIAILKEKLSALDAAGQQQRKQITVLFADVSGFTAMSETMDAEDVSDNMNALWRRVDAAIAQFGGHIDKHIGDAVMALWGVYRARENDPEQAIRGVEGVNTKMVGRDAYLDNYFKRLATREPLVILLEDMHWADDSSLDAVDELARRLRRKCFV
jgi:class 3 adenylate cyclase